MKLRRKYMTSLKMSAVFELLVWHFTRKRTLLEILIGIQMLEYPRRIRILSKFKSYYLELKKFTDNADQLLN